MQYSMKHTLRALLAAISTASATTTPFETQTELDAYTSVITPITTPLQLTLGAFGANSTNGLRYVGSTYNTDRSFLCYIALPGDATTQNSFTTSILVNLREFDTLAEDKGEFRLGFSAGTSVSSSKPHEFFHKNNPSISLRLNAEHKASDSTKFRRLDAQLINRVAGEANVGGTSANNSIHFDDWLKVTVTVIRTGTDTVNASYLIESLGSTGTSTPVAVLSSGPHALTNNLFTAATALQTGFAVKPEKARATATFLDDHTYTSDNLPPTAPTAVASTAVAATGLTVNWSAPSGLPATTYTVELSKTSDYFAASTLISATGTTGQATGVSVASPALSLAFTNLLPETSYSYRITATNAVGSSVASSVITATTLASGTNNPPTLNAIADQGPVSTFITPILIPLTGVTAGGESGQTLTATVTPANSAIITSGTLSTPNASGNATLTLIPTGTQGTTAITVVLDDGQPAANTFSRTFNITVRNPIEKLNFGTATDLNELVTSTNSNVTHAFNAAAGIGNPATGGVLVSSSSTSGDRGFGTYRQQGDFAPGATFFHSSILINASQLDDVASESEFEVRLGYLSTFNVNSVKPHEFLHKSNDSIHIKIKMEHKVTDPGKQRRIEGELASAVGGNETKLAQFNAANQASINGWLRLTFDLFPAGGNDFLASWKLESLGEFGTDTPVVIFQSSQHPFTNATLAAATTLHAAYAGKMDKQLTSARLDEHQSIVNRSAPDAPLANSANLVTATSFNANWQPGTATPSSSWTLQVIAIGSTFTPGNFIAADGTTAQATGIPIANAALSTLRIENLNGATTLRYRLIGTNINGSSPPSNEVAVLTLPVGANSAPTLAVIAKPAPIAISAAEQIQNLAGITSGGETSQILSVTATSSNVALIPNPTVTYTSPNATGSLAYTPVTGAVGTAVITVTVNDGAASNNTISRTFSVTVVDPDPLLDFNDPADFASLAVSQIASTLVNQTNNGTGSPSTGSLAFNGTTPGAERGAVIIRPVAYDAASAVHLITSLDFKATDVFNNTVGKEKGELRLGFMGSNTANTSKPQDTLTKTHPSIAIRFKMENEPGSSDKVRLFECELAAWTGSTEIKGQKLSLLNYSTDDNWLRVTLTAVRNGTSSAIVSYTVDDMGPDGTTFISRVIESGTDTIANAAFFADNTVFAAATISDEKTSSANLTLRADNYSAEVNTTAPSAPATQQVSGLTATGFTANWTAALGGNFSNGFLVEIVPQGMPFLAGNYLSATGSTGQTSGITVSDAFANSLAITGLTNSTNYRVRVRAFASGTPVSNSLALNSVFATTLVPPGIEYAAWRTTTFGANAANESIAGANAINNGAGISNLLAYAFGLDPFTPDLSLLPQVTTSGQYLRISYRRRHNVTGITVTPTISSDLQSFGSQNVVIVSTSAPVNGFVTVIAEDQFTKVSNPRRFMRVEVTTAQ
jgi:Fibronectin type III domain